jgi:peptidyl-prolyl cis-trans isomerase SurA
MKHVQLAIGLMIMLLVQLAHAETGSRERIDQVVAIVNEEVIPESELDQTLQRINQQIAESHVSDAPPADVLRKQVLDQLIVKTLQLQIAKQAGITIQDQEINEAIRRIADQNHVSVAELYDHLHQDGMSTAEYRHEISEQMMIQKLQQHEIASKISVTPQEITEALKAAMKHAKAGDELPSRQTIESVLLQQKFEESLQQWISKLRGQAYIKVM